MAAALRAGWQGVLEEAEWLGNEAEKDIKSSGLYKGRADDIRTARAAVKVRRKQEYEQHYTPEKSELVLGLKVREFKQAALEKLLGQKMEKGLTVHQIELQLMLQPYEDVERACRSWADNLKVVRRLRQYKDLLVEALVALEPSARLMDLGKKKVVKIEMLLLNKSATELNSVCPRLIEIADQRYAAYKAACLAERAIEKELQVAASVEAAAATRKLIADSAAAAKREKFGSSNEAELAGDWVLDMIDDELNEYGSISGEW